MSSDSVRSLREFVSLVRGTTYKGELVGNPGPVLLGLASIQPDGGFRWGSFKTYGGECPAKITLGPGDLYVSLKDVTQSGDLLGAVARVPKEIHAGRLTQDTVKLDFHDQTISRGYIYWLLRTPEYRSYCRSHATGTTTLGLARDDFLNFPVLLPGEYELSLVNLLEAIEERITLLRETNTTLEAIAQALFKSWFVDFDPVRAKMEGRVPQGMDEATAALFPDSFEETELGAVPRGWVAGTFGNVLTEYSKRIGSLQATVLSAVQTGELVRSDEHFNKKVHSESIEKYKSVPPLAFAYNPSRINIGSIGINESSDLGAVSPVYVVATAFSKGAAYLVWHHLRTQRVRGAIATLATGTVRQSLSYSDFSSISLVTPSTKVLDIFLEYRNVLYQRIWSISDQIRSLEEIRDTLLPRLISGQLRLPEAQAELEDALT